jgi:hypothetical protein
MKTLILTKKEIDSLPKEVQDQVMNVYNNRQNEISLLKKRVKELKCNSYNVRDDVNLISITRTGIEAILYFDIWHKTGGEQWGNCSGRKYEIRIGRKYIRVDIEFYATNNNNSGSIESVYISESKLAEILDLLEEAQNFDKSDVLGEVDFDRVVLIAANRLQSALHSWY